MERIPQYGKNRTSLAKIKTVWYDVFGDNMVRNIEKTELLNIVHGISADRGEYRNRSSHGLLFRLHGETRYCFSGMTICHKPGDVLFIPKGADYHVRKLTEGEGRYLVINFLGEGLPDEPRLIAIGHLSDYRGLCARLVKNASPDTAAEQFRQSALFYEVLALLCEASDPGYVAASARAKIEPAVRYLRENLYELELQVGKLHIRCGISDTYFRKLFSTVYGDTPWQYVINKRLERAKALLDNGEYNSIAEVALASGFEDPLYFSKAFRRKYGCPPSRLHREQAV